MIRIALSASTIRHSVDSLRRKIQARSGKYGKRSSRNLVIIGLVLCVVFGLFYVGRHVVKNSDIKRKRTDPVNEVEPAFDPEVWKPAEEAADEPEAPFDWEAAVEAPAEAPAE